MPIKRACGTAPLFPCGEGRGGSEEDTPNARQTREGERERARVCVSEESATRRWGRGTAAPWEAKEAQRGREGGREVVWMCECREREGGREGGRGLPVPPGGVCV